MTPDYYQILGVSIDATIGDIRIAYRQRCRECHPDRGGSHERMVQLNEAWEVLSNPEMRRRYDEFCSGTSSSAQSEAAQHDRADARQRAQNYPRQWADFERWLDSMTADFARAKYRTSRGAFFTFPTAGESVSGWLFIIGGALAAAIAAWKMGALPKDKNPAFAGVIFAAGGAWLGRVVHEVSRYTLFAQNRHDDVPAETIAPIVLACPQCGQKLRLPKLQKDMTVTCTGCRHRFDHSPARAASPESLNQDPWQLRQQLVKTPHNVELRKAYLAVRTDLIRMVDDGVARHLGSFLGGCALGAVIGAMSGGDPQTPLRLPLIYGVVGGIGVRILFAADEKTRARYAVQAELGPLPEDTPVDLGAARDQYLPSNR